MARRRDRRRRDARQDRAVERRTLHAEETFDLALARWEAKLGTMTCTGFATRLAVLVVVVVATLIVGCKRREAYEDDPKGKDARVTAGQLLIAADSYRAEFHGACPTTDQLGKTGYLDPASLAKPIATIDPWGKPYKITCNGEQLAVRSFGPDRVEATDDDIGTQFGKPAP